MQFVVFAVAAVATLVGALTDIQKREIADWISVSLLVFGIGAGALYSVVFWTPEPIAFSIAGLAAFFLLGWFMFRMGWWGGGDSKLLIAFGACFGLPFSLAFPYVQPDGFMVSFISNFLISSAAYTLFWFVFLIVAKREKFGWILAETIAERRRGVVLGAAAGAVLLAGSAAVPRLDAKILLAMAGLVLLLYFCVLPAARSVERLMLRRVSPYELTEGELIAEEVFVEGRVVAGPACLGASKEQIKELQELSDQGKIRSVLIKVGIPLIPNFLITMMMTHFFGNVLELAFQGLRQTLAQF